VHVSTAKLLDYGMIMGRDLLQELGIILDFSTRTITWESTTIEMPSTRSIHKRELTVVARELDEPVSVTELRKRTVRILDASYLPADLDKMIKGQTEMTDENEKNYYYS